jgi:hypothetical protein
MANDHLHDVGIDELMRGAARLLDRAAEECEGMRAPLMLRLLAFHWPGLAQSWIASAAVREVWRAEIADATPPAGARRIPKNLGERRDQERKDQVVILTGQLAHGMALFGQEPRLRLAISAGAVLRVAAQFARQEADKYEASVAEPPVRPVRR